MPRTVTPLSSKKRGRSVTLSRVRSNLDNKENGLSIISTPLARKSFVDSCTKRMALSWKQVNSTISQSPTRKKPRTMMKMSKLWMKLKSHWWILIFLDFDQMPPSSTVAASETHSPSCSFEKTAHTGPSIEKLRTFDNLNESLSSNVESPCDVYQIIHMNNLIALLKQTMCVSCGRSWSGDFFLRKREGT